MENLINLTEKQARQILWTSDLKSFCSDVSEIDVVWVRGTFNVLIMLNEKILKTLSIEDYKKSIS